MSPQRRVWVMVAALVLLLVLALRSGAQSGRDTAGYRTWPVTTQDSTGRWACVRSCDAATRARVDSLNAHVAPNYVTFDRHGNPICGGPDVARIAICPQYNPQYNPQYDTPAARRARRAARGARP